MALYDGVNIMGWSCLATEAVTRGTVFSRMVPTLDTHLDVENQRDNMGQLSPVGGGGPPAGAEF